MWQETVEGVLGILGVWAYLVLIAAWRAAPLFVVAWGVTWALRRKISPTVEALMWSVVIARFLLPFSLESGWSLHGLTDAALESAWANPQPSVPMGVDLAVTLETLDAQSSVPLPTATAASSVQISLLDWLLALAILSVVIVTQMLVLRSLFAQVRFWILLRGSAELNEPGLIDVLLRECDSLKVRQRPMLREVVGLSTPAVFGVFRATICLPVGFVSKVSGEELRWVLRHELAHIRRRDPAMMVLASVAQAFHWFNPLIWLAVGNLRSSMETAADRLAMEKGTAQEMACYGHLILRLAEGSDGAGHMGPAMGLISFAASDRLKQRMEMLVQDMPQRSWLTMFGVVSVIALAFFGLTDAAEKKEVEREAAFLAPTKGASIVQEEKDQGPRTSRVYDISEVRKKLLSGEDKAVSDDKELESLLRIVASDGKFQLEGESLVVELTAAQHESLERMLEAWKVGGLQQISIETRIMQTSVKMAESIDWLENRAEGLRSQGPAMPMAVRVSEGKLQRFIQSMQSDARSNILQSPKVTMFNGQTATIADQIQRPFVTGVEPGEGGQIKPVVTMFYEGKKLKLSPVVQSNGEMELSFEAETSLIDEVATATLPIRLPDDKATSFLVQVPSVDMTKVSATVKLKKGESILLAYPHVEKPVHGRKSAGMILVAITPRSLGINPDAAK